MSDFIMGFVELIKNIVAQIQDLITQIRASNDKK